MAMRTKEFEQQIQQIEHKEGIEKELLLYSTTMDLLKYVIACEHLGEL